MKNSCIVLFTMMSFYGFSQITVPPFHGLYADTSNTNPNGGNAICSSSSQTTVVPITSPSTGKIWMDRNLGASQAATTSTDYLAYGCLYQWGRGNDDHASITWSSSNGGTPVNGSTTTLSSGDTPGNGLFIYGSTGDWRASRNDQLWQGQNGINNPCPNGYLIPTSAEMDAEFSGNAITNAANAFSSVFKFTVPGNRQYSSGIFSETGTAAIYANSTVVDANGSCKYITSASATNMTYGRGRGYSVRCIKAPVSAICDGSQPTTVVPITSSTGKIWMDRNLGASQAGTSSTDYAAYGCLYQWGRGNDGHASINWNSSTSGTPVNGTTTTLATTDSPGNALFITNATSPFDWRSNNNATRWQGINGVNNPCPSGYRVPTISELTTEVTAYGIINATTAYTYGPNGGFKFVLAGGRNDANGAVVNQGTAGNGYYLSVTPNGITSYNLYVNSGSAASNYSNRAFGASVRCIKEPVHAICDGSTPTTVVEITSTTGRVWMDRNMGASQAATKLDDYAAYGCLYQWGRGNDGHASIDWSSATAGTPINGTTTTLATTDSPGNALFIATSAAPNDWRSNNNNTRWQTSTQTNNNPCPSGFQVPSSTELAAEYSAYGIANSSDAYALGGNGGFKFVTAGYRSSSTGGGLVNPGIYGNYWTSTVNGTNANYHYNTPVGTIDSNSLRAFGCAVRCIKTLPQVTAVVEITSSVSGRIWMDRNLGATQLATSATDFLAYGNLYQWGRSSDGHEKISWTSSTVGTPVNAGTTTTLAVSDTAVNPLFITASTAPSDWRSDNNDTRWQQNGKVNNPCPTGFSVPTDSEFQTELTGYGIISATTAYSTGPFKLTVQGQRFFNTGALANVGSRGYYWTSTVSGTSSILRTFAGSVGTSVSPRANGGAIRCIKD